MLHAVQEVEELKATKIMNFESYFQRNLTFSIKMSKQGRNIFLFVNEIFHKSPSTPEAYQIFLPLVLTLAVNILSGSATLLQRAF